MKVKEIETIKIGLFIFNSILVLAQASLTSLPPLNLMPSSSSEFEKISITEKQTVKISPQDNALQYIKLGLTENKQQIPFCRVQDRSINRQDFANLLIQSTTVDKNGFATSQIAFTQSWAPLTQVEAFFQANVVHLDSSQNLRFVRIDPSRNTTTVVNKLRIEDKYLSSNYNFNTVRMVQMDNKLLIGIQNDSNQISFIYVYNNQNFLYTKEIKNIVLYTDKGNLQEINIVKLPNGDSMLFVLQTTIMSSFILDQNLVTIKQIAVQTFQQGSKPQKQFSDFKIWVDKSQDQINIFVLCEINGIFKLEYKYTGALATTVTNNSSFFIVINNAALFNVYQGKQVFVTTNTDLYEVREYELMVQDANSKYYLNRIHQVDHKIKDIIVYDFFFIMMGSNSNTISWHSVHPTVIKDMQALQQYFLVLGLQGGSILNIYNSTSNLEEPYFVGIQRFHIFVNKIVPQSGYVLCTPSNVTDDVTGLHKINITFTYQEWQNLNSYSVKEFTMIRQLEINRVYADKLTAGVIAAIVISILVFIIAIIVIICIKIKRQRNHKYTLQKELEQYQNQRNTLQVANTDQSPNNMIKRLGSQLPLSNSQKTSNMIRKDSVDEQKIQQVEDVQIIKFDEDDE